MKVTVVPIVIGQLGSHQRVGKGIGGIGNKSTSGDHPNYSIIKIGQILRRVLETCCHSNSSGRLSANAGVKNSQRSKTIIIIIIIINFSFYYSQEKTLNLKEELTDMIYPLSMDSWMRIIYPSGLNKGVGLKFPRVKLWQITEGRKIKQLKYHSYINNQDVDISSKTWSFRMKFYL